MHILVQLQQLTRKEFERGLEGVTDADARTRIEPMNCISWIIGHVAQQQHTFYVARAQGIEIAPEYREFGFGSQATQPPLDEMMALWRASCDEADEWLLSATEASLMQTPVSRGPIQENFGTLMVRNIFHTWHHIGEINSIRQILGHKPPQFVNMQGWSFGGE